MEAAIGLPVFLLLLAAIIDLGWLLTQHLVVCDVMEKVAREVTASATGGSCSVLAQSKFSAVSAAAPVKIDYGGTAVQVTAEVFNITSGTFTIPINGLRLNLSGRHQCLSCWVIPGCSGGYYGYSQSRLVVQQGGTCTAP